MNFICGAFLFVSLSITPALAAPSAPARAVTVWDVKKETWSETDERGFSTWVQALGESGCRTFNQCLKSPANPYRSSDPSNSNFHTDCADLPYHLRAYYAWKNNLPFGYVNEVRAVRGSVSRDIRYSSNGNEAVSRVDLLPTQGERINPARAIEHVGWGISSAMYRYHPTFDGTSRLFPDFYSVKVDRNSVKPGTIIYDPNGHVAIVYKVGDDGRIYFMDAHPDNSLTRGQYGKKFARARPGMGAGFKRFRPVRIVGATRDARGNYMGGRLEGTPNRDIPDYSIEQFFGEGATVSSLTSSSDQNWRQGLFSIRGQTVDYYDYVRMKLAVGELRFNPVRELEQMLEALCQDVRDRVIAVQDAIDSNQDDVAHPSQLPYNIYGTDGDWETYSTPSRDARLKTSFKEMRDRTAEFITRHASHDPMIHYQGQNLIRDLGQVYRRQTQACVVAYKNSAGIDVSLNLDQVLDRLFLLSFDPYHCVERRWGATLAVELTHCREDASKRAWYLGEQRLRNQIDRTYDARMDFTVNQLTQDLPGNGLATAPDVDIKRVLGIN